jgi:hypothetical protein
MRPERPATDRIRLCKNSQNIPINSPRRPIFSTVVQRDSRLSRRDLPKGVFTTKTQYFREKFLRVVFLLYICTPQTAQITKQKGYCYGNEKNVPAVAPEENQQARFPPENVHG